jgi:hypothetical protein
VTPPLRTRSLPAPRPNVPLLFTDPLTTSSLRAPRLNVPLPVTDPLTTQVACRSTVIAPKSAKLVPIPAIVPVLAPEASSSVSDEALVTEEPWAPPMNTAPGSSISRLVPPENATLPLIVPLLVSVTPEAATPKDAPVIVPLLNRTPLLAPTPAPPCPVM